MSAGVLPLEPVVLFEDGGAGAGVSAVEQGELVSAVRDGAGERAGGWRMLLAA